MNRAAKRKGEPTYKMAIEEDMNDLITHEENVLN